MVTWASPSAESRGSQWRPLEQIKHQNVSLSGAALGLAKETLFAGILRKNVKTIRRFRSNANQ